LRGLHDWAKIVNPRQTGVLVSCAAPGRGGRDRTPAGQRLQSGPQVLGRKSLGCASWAAGPGSTSSVAPAN